MCLTTNHRSDLTHDLIQRHQPNEHVSLPAECPRLVQPDALQQWPCPVDPRCLSPRPGTLSLSSHLPPCSSCAPTPSTAPSRYPPAPLSTASLAPPQPQFTATQSHAPCLMLQCHTRLDRLPLHQTAPSPVRYANPISFAFPCPVCCFRFGLPIVAVCSSLYHPVLCGVEYRTSLDRSGPVSPAPLPDGTYVVALSFCPNGITCPLNAPFVCWDRTCVYDPPTTTGTKRSPLLA